MRLLFRCILLAAVLPALAPAQQPATAPLRRRALAGVGASLAADGVGMRVTSVIPGGTGAALGLRADDLILRIGDAPMTSAEGFGKAMRSWRAGERVTLLVRRQGALVALAAPAVAYPEERADGLDIRYQAVTTDYGDRVRTIVARPAGARGRLPAMLLVPWLSCSSVEMSMPQSLAALRDVLHGVARAGYAVWRVDKPGVGDSEGPDCSELDYRRELAAYRAAYAEMRRSADVDSGAIVLFGSSLGGSIAPQLAAEHRPRALLIQGTYARSWFEHIIDFERRRLELSGRTPAEVDRDGRLLAELYAGYLLERRTPADVIREKPHLAAVWYDAPAHQFGRPAEFYHQVQQAQIGATWARLDVPTLVLWGDHDWIMAREDHELIVRLLKGKGELVVLPGLDHDLMRHGSPEAAFRDEPGQVTPEPLRVVREWLARVAPAR
ncbi:MAG TPA: alpha/beta fold hydrolase [Gemmatimonadaceae bacterium]|nr:alpha/beta fold hydrolase [Gemmatimonadaceae bacterium]